MKLFSVNSKMARSTNSKYRKIVNFTLPAFRAKDGFKTCPQAGNCASACYARSGFYMFKNVSGKHHKNLDATLSPSFVDTAIAELIKSKPDLVRIHDAGDFYSVEYFNYWINIVEALPHIRFYAYTKMVKMVKEFSAAYPMPKNLTIIFSLGGKQDSLIDQRTDRHSRVFPDLASLRAAGYIDTSHDDTHAIGVNHRIGLVYHHPKSWDNAAWKNVKTNDT